MPLLWLSLAFICGIVLAASLTLPWYIWLSVGAVGLVLAIPPIHRRVTSHLPPRFPQIARRLKISSLVLFPLFIVFLAVGAIRYQIVLPKLDARFIAYYNDKTVEYNLNGVIIEPPDRRETYTNLRLRIDQIQNADATQAIPVRGLVLARIPSSSQFNYGDRVLLEGHLESPPEDEDFSYRDYLAHQGIYSYIAYPRISLLQSAQASPILGALYAFQSHAVDIVYRLFPDPEASLMAGILLGVQSGIPAEVQEAFRLTGTSHIIVISGFNITIIAAMFGLLFSRILGERRGALIAAVGIIFYALMVGANPAVVRAAILGLLMLFGHQVGRRQVGLNSLAFVAAVMALLSPLVLWDVSFQLSFAATLGIMVYAEPLTNSFTNAVARFIPRDKAERLAGPIGTYLLITLAAQITCLPLMAYYFKRISLTSLIANPLILPLQPPLMVLGGLSVLAGLIFLPVGQLLAWSAWPFAAYTIRMVERLATVPHGSISLGQIALPLILLFYLFLFIITFTKPRLSNLTSRLTPAMFLTFLAIVTVIVWNASFKAPDGLLHTTVFDVGTGEAVLIQSPSGRTVLINGGSSTNKLSEALGRRMSIFSRSIDWLVVADIDNEDLAGLPGNLERFSPAQVLWAGNTYGTRSATDLLTQLISQSIPITPMQAGQALDLGSGASLQVLSTDSRGAVLLLEWDNFRMLLPMGADFDALVNLQKDTAMRNISAFLLAESGYAPLNPPELVSSLRPQLILLSVAAGDKTGLPSPETIEAVKGYNLLRTDRNGWIKITTDGKQMWVEAERK